MLGESSAFVAVGAAAALYAAIATAPAQVVRSRSSSVVPALLIAEALAFAGSSMALSFPAVRIGSALFVLYFIVALALYEAYLRPALIASALRCLTWLVGIACASYVVSWAVGFMGAVDTSSQYRDVIVYPPATVTQPSGGFLTEYGFPRLLVLAGEPGLGALFIVIALWCALAFWRGGRRLALLALLATGVVATQSIGLVFGLVAFAVGATLVEVTRRLTLGVSVVLALVLIPVTARVGNFLIASKEADNPESLTDRGLPLTGLRLTASDADISLVATLSHHAVLAIPLIALIGYLAFRVVRDPLSLGLVFAVASIALYAQPLQWHPGVWFLVAAALTIAAPHLRPEGRAER
jgi:hypothetical protein